MLRLGMLQLLAETMPALALRGVSPEELEESERTFDAAELVLISVRSAQEVQALVSLAIGRLSPKWVLLLADTVLSPDLLRNLPSTVSGCVTTSACPDVLAASIRLILAGGKCFPMPTASSQPESECPLSGATACEVNGRHWPDGHDPSAEHGNGFDHSHASEAELLRLTPRQYEVLVLLARGYPIKTVSRQLNISVATAKAHAGTLYQRLNVRNKSEAVYAAVARGAKLDWQRFQDLEETAHHH